MPELITDTQAEEAERRRQEEASGRVAVRMVDQDGGESMVYVSRDDPLAQRSGQTLISTPTGTVVQDTATGRIVEDKREDRRQEIVREVEEQARGRERQDTPKPTPRAIGHEVEPETTTPQRPVLTSAVRE